VARAHGLRGEVAVKTFDPASEALFDVKRIALCAPGGDPRERAVEHSRETKNEVLLTLDGVRTREAAEVLVGSRVLVARMDLAPPEEGEFFQGDLVGLTAVDEQGNVVGKVEAVWNTGPVPNLVIRAGTEEWLVPFTDAFVPSVDLEAGRLVVRKPEMVE
jgi:16S rRNA processing protein RimM